MNLYIIIPSAIYFLCFGINYHLEHKIYKVQFWFTSGLLLVILFVIFPRIQIPFNGISFFIILTGVGSVIAWIYCTNMISESNILSKFILEILFLQFFTMAIICLIKGGLI